MTTQRIGILSGVLLILYSTGAIALDAVYSGNPEMEARFCRSYVCASEIPLRAAHAGLWNPAAGNSQRPLGLLREVLERDPHNPLRWLDLAEAHLAAKNERQARYCIERASHYGAQDAPVRLRAGLAYLRMADSEAALRELSWVLSSVRKYDALIFSTYERIGVNAETALRAGLGNDANAARSYIRHLFREADHEEAATIWNWLSDRSLETREVAMGYIRSLLKANKYWQARDVHCRFAAGNCEPDEQNLVLNPRFDQNTIDSPLDWKMDSSDHFSVAQEKACGEDGTSGCAVIRFDGEDNVAFQHLSQHVAVRPGSYRFEARLRAEGVTTDQGIGFRLRDAESAGRLDRRTLAVNGQTDWLTITETVEIPPETRLIQIEAIRQRSFKFNNKIGGTVWIDSVALRPI